MSNLTMLCRRCGVLALASIEHVAYVIISALVLERTFLSLHNFWQVTSTRLKAAVFEQRGTLYNRVFIGQISNYAISR